MAGVFLSYDRDDSDAARVIANALEKAGHSVWWDLHVRGGAQFAKVIEEALKAADVVVVLWSANSIESAWVRDEAGAGRDRGRLVPATIDGTPAPLGFKQFQTIELTDWKRGMRSHGYKLLEQSISEFKGGTPAQPMPILNEWPRTRRLWLIAAPAAAAIAAAGYFFSPGSSGAVPTVAVLPASGSSMSQALSRDLLAKLGILQASNNSTLQLVDQGSAKTPDLFFKVDASNDDARLKASLLLLSGKKRALLWSGDFDQPSNNVSDLKQQIAYSAANVLDCVSQAYGPPGQSLDEATRKLYLNGCGSFTQVVDTDSNSLIRTFREVTRRAPRFEGGWVGLLTAQDEVIFNPPFTDDTPPVRARFRADIAAARKVNADMPEAYIAESDLIASTKSLLQSIRLLDLAAQRNPDSPSALVARSFAFVQVGRLREAVSDARRAIRIQPFSARAQEGYISVLTYAGQFESAQAELAKADALFPGATNFGEARFRLNLRYGSAEDALKWVHQHQALLPQSMETFLKARIDRTPRNIDAAVETARKGMDGTPITSADYVQILAEFGRTDELLNFLTNFPTPRQPGRFVGVLFRPAFTSFWRDPRSMQVARRFGLVEYWQSTGHWPDFCSNPQFPYDCKKEAAKLEA